MKNDVLKFFGMFLGSTTDRMFYSLIFNDEYIYARNNYSSIRMKNFYINTSGQYSLNLDLAIDYFKVFKKDEYEAYVHKDKLIGENNSNKIELDLQTNKEDLQDGFYDFPENLIVYDYENFVNRINAASSIGFPDEHFNFVIDIDSDNIFSLSNTTFIKTPFNNIDCNGEYMLLNFRYEFVRHLYKLLTFIYVKPKTVKLYYNEDYCIFDLGSFIIKYIFKNDNSISETMGAYSALNKNSYKEIFRINSPILRELSKDFYTSTKKFPAGHFIQTSDNKIFFIQNMYNNKLSTKKMYVNCNSKYLIHINNNQFYKFLRTIGSTEVVVNQNLSNYDFDKFDIFKMNFGDITLYTF